MYQITRRIVALLAIVTIGLAAGWLGHGTFAAEPQRPLPAVACTGSDCVIYDLATQSQCSEVTEAATFDPRWTTGLSTNVDQTIKGGEIVAYKLRWWSGSWTNWFVTGVNDIDIKYNTTNKTMRRMWSYFYDHQHTYLICTG